MKKIVLTALLSLGVLFTWGLLNKVDSQAAVPQECKKLGINYAVVGPVANSEIDRAHGLNFGYSLEIATDPSQVWGIGLDSFDYALDNGITPILRICYGSTCNFSNPNTYVSFINQLADIVGWDREFYVIAGPNEPLSENWLGYPQGNYSLAGPAVANYMNTVITGVDRPNVKILSPVFNTTHPDFENFATAMNNAGANWAGLDGIAMNAYNLKGYSLGEEITDFVTRVRNAGFSGYDIYLTEIGMYESELNPNWWNPQPHALALSRLETEISLMKSDNKIKAYLLFNSFGTNPDPNFVYNHMSDAQIENANGSECLAYGQIANLDPGLNVTNLSGELLESGSGNEGGGEVVRLENTGGTRIAEVYVDFNGDQDWSAVTAGTDSVTKKAFAHNLTSAPGTVSEFTLFIPKGNLDDAVYICPGASNLSEVTNDCAGGYALTEVDSNVMVVNLGGNNYWQVSGLGGTGGISIINNFNVLDTLSRLEISQTSDHTIEFGSTNNTNTSGDTIAIQFAPGGLDWDLSSLTISDIDLEDDGIDKTLAAAPGADIWGTVINTVTDTITFTAPTSGTDYIASGSIVVVKIGTNADGGSNQITNPATVNSYEIAITITNSSGTETGEVEVPIIDDDTVNVTGYIDTFLTFDIDTSEVDEDCDAAGGVNPCDSHGGSTDNAGYVVDLGEMTISVVNDSGDTVLHADGLSGEINSIYFDLSSNSSAGAVVTVQSLNASLNSGSGNIPTVANGSEVQITAGSGLYGINSFAGLTNTTTSGNAIISVDCDGTNGSDYYCDTPASAVEIFNSNNAPIDELRLEWEVGVSPDALDGSGTYTDQLTFIATTVF